LIGSFLNLRPLANWIIEKQPPNLILVCSGTYEQAALEDTLAAGALCEKIWVHYAGGAVSDSAEVARRIYPLMQMDLIGAMNHARNGRRLLANADLRNDVWYCLQRETLNFLAEFKGGLVQRMD
jgi:2-phosphosulfolactate phosphatase